MSSSQQKRQQIGSKQYMNNKYFYRPPICLFCWELLICPNDLKFGAGLTHQIVYHTNFIENFLNLFWIFYEFFLTGCRWVWAPKHPTQKVKTSLPKTGFVTSQLFCRQQAHELFGLSRIIAKTSWAVWNRLVGSSKPSRLAPERAKARLGPCPALSLGPSNRTFALWRKYTRSLKLASDGRFGA